MLILVLLSFEKRVIEVHQVATSSKIDGYIEEIWHTADSAYDFIQLKPNEAEPSTEPTIVYVLADDQNLYFAYQCFTPGRKPYASFKGLEDHIYLFIDSFDSKTTAYFFSVCASGYHEDGLILENGKVWDWAWDGVWFFDVKCYDEHFEIEFKIPFKSIRYKKGLTDWGVNFERVSVKNYETTFWAPVNQKENMQVSQFGKLSGIVPKAKGHYVELYPEGFLRYDNISNKKDYKSGASFNMKWDITPQTTVNATVYPDFAQIESDPYTLNLSRYPTRLDERRPFFIEGSEVFRMSSLGESYFTPLEIFYSRRIGKPLAEGGSVPILGGLKFINKEKRWNFGLLASITDETNSEPYQGFAVLRARRNIMENSEIGMLISSAATAIDSYNYAIGIDGSYRRGASQFILQSAFSDRNTKKGWAVSSGGLYKTEKIFVNASFISISDSFDVEDIGYAPWAGITKLYLTAGPNKYYKQGPIQQISFGPGCVLTKEPGSNDWSKILFSLIELQFRYGWGVSAQGAAGRLFEADTNYIYHSFYATVWSGYHKMYRTHFGFDYSYIYNYYRDWLGYQSTLWFWGAYYPISPLSLSTEIDFVVEWDPDHNIAAITPYATPRIEYKITRDMDIAVYSQLVFQTEDGDLSYSEIYSNRIGFLFSWNFRPKSWFYIALNDYRVNFGNGLASQERIGAVKLKYVIYF